MIENSPHTHSTIICPIRGDADNKLVITIAPRNDICPHGNTYLKNAVATDKNKIILPINQT